MFLLEFEDHQPQRQAELIWNGFFPIMDPTSFKMGFNKISGQAHKVKIFAEILDLASKQGVWIKSQ